jgi:hypothetical protein
MTAIRKDHSLTWAEDVMSVYEHIQRGYGDDEDEATESRRQMLMFAQNPENQKEFFKMIAPKAAEMIAKFNQKSPAEEQFLLHEKKSIAELRQALGEAVNAAECVN